jgi:hypothetical protein
MMVRVQDSRPTRNILSERARSQRHSRTYRGHHAKDFPPRELPVIELRIESTPIVKRHGLLHRRLPLAIILR